MPVFLLFLVLTLLVQFLQQRNVGVVIRDEHDFNVVRISNAMEKENAKAMSKGKEKFSYIVENAIHWMDEKLAQSSRKRPLFGTCCSKGKTRLPLLMTPPPPLQALYDGDDDQARSFRRYTRVYNAANAFTSLGATLDPRVLRGSGPKPFIIHGELRHRTGSLLPQPGQDATYAQLYIYDPNSALEVRNRRNPHLQKDVLKTIQDNSMAITRYNQHPDIFLTMTANPNWPEITSALLQHQKAIDRPDLIARGYDRTTMVLGLINEIQQYLDARYIGPPEAAWRIFGHHLHAEMPTVVRLALHLPGMHHVLFNPNDSLEMILSRAAQQKSTLTACVARGLLEDDEEWIQCLKEAAVMKTGYQLRRLFCIILTQCFPLQPHALWNQFSMHICDDLAHKLRTLFAISNPTEAQIEDYGLYLLNQMLQESGKSLIDFPPMPQPTANWSATVGNRLIFEHQQLHNEAQQTDVQITIDRLNNGQRTAYNAITSSVFESKGTIFFLNGGAGTRKTFLYNTIALKCRSLGHTVVTMASSGIASLLLIGTNPQEIIKIPSIIHKCQDLKELLSAVYPQLDMVDTSTPSFLMERNTYTYLAADKMVEDDEIDPSITNRYPNEFLNPLDPSGLPAFKVELKVGCPIMFLRNIALKDGLCNGTRLMVSRCDTRIIEARILTREKFGNLAFIPRISLTLSSVEMPFRMTRHQFPIRLAYALTINKSQGQSVNLLGLICVHLEICADRWDSNTRCRETNGSRFGAQKVIGLKRSLEERNTGLPEYLLPVQLASSVGSLTDKTLSSRLIRSPSMANNDEILLSAIDGATPKFTRRREGHPAILPVANLDTFTGGQSGDARDKRGRSYGHSRSPDGHRRRRESHARRLEHKLRDQDAVIRRMAAEMEELKRHVKGKDVDGVVGDSDVRTEKSSAQDSTYQPSRPVTTSRYSYSACSEDLRAVLKERARRREAQRVPAFQRLSYRVHASEEVGMPPPRLAAPLLVDTDLARLSATPFSLEIETTPLSAGFHQLKFTLYDGKTDPYMHVSHFRQVMAGRRRNDALMCLIFPSSLGKLGLKWFERLPEGSIERWQWLAEAFVTRFKTNTKTPKEVDHLLSVRMEPSDTLKAYNSRYWDTFNEILDCPVNLAITQYKRGLPLGYRLKDSLTMSQQTSMWHLMQRINEHIRVEDDAATSTAETTSMAMGKWATGEICADRWDSSTKCRETNGGRFGAQKIFMVRGTMTLTNVLGVSHKLMVGVLT
ncbi:hypothetical protein HYC85_029645 [Camellia sinensis]|uniref:ATP-dependent DNA helicase n=1 Tax=Camellia sinensis TaxID=4442 RepID=A0A7J7G2F8_CAMSI|nr:hypothetical protein HYC85_029645 [Camellia sinensis]